METDWDLSQSEWSVMSRATKCGLMRYPHNSRLAYEWAEQLYRKAISGGPSPEAQRDEQCPGLTKAYKQRKPKFNLM